ncbi:MAG: hypothetical protein MMC23_002027 [Stictis urceolatum]|nr:hypothetical protein [Stictis urceolata]
MPSSQRISAWRATEPVPLWLDIFGPLLTVSLNALLAAVLSHAHTTPLVLGIALMLGLPAIFFFVTVLGAFIWHHQPRLIAAARRVGRWLDNRPIIQRLLNRQSRLHLSATVNPFEALGAAENGQAVELRDLGALPPLPQSPPGYGAYPEVTAPPTDPTLRGLPPVAADEFPDLFVLSDDSDGELDLDRELDSDDDISSHDLDYDTEEDIGVFDDGEIDAVLRAVSRVLGLPLGGLHLGEFDGRDVFGVTEEELEDVSFQVTRLGEERNPWDDPRGAPPPYSPRGKARESDPSRALEAAIPPEASDEGLSTTANSSHEPAQDLHVPSASPESRNAFESSQRSPEERSPEEGSIWDEF